MGIFGRKKAAASKSKSKAGRKPSSPKALKGKAAAPHARRANVRAQGSQKKAPVRRSSFWVRATRFSVYWCLVLGLWGTLGVLGIFAWYGAQLPQSSKWDVPDRAPNVRVLDASGKLLADRGLTGGQRLSLAEISPYIPAAVKAIEDRRFEKHFGVDPIGLARAMIRNAKEGRVVQGGSTLTQQLAKNLFLTPERSIGRKVQEAILAVWLEQQYSKDKIMEMYLNRVYFGSGATGVEAASLRYFNKSARDVSLAEAATLAGLLKAPSRLSPARNPEAANKRAKLVLNAMLRDNTITRQQHARAADIGPKKADRYWNGPEHYVADWVMDRLPRLTGGKPDQDLVVYTSINHRLQAFADQIVRETLNEHGQKKNVSQGALVALDSTGAVRAMVGGKDYAKSQFNRSVEAKRQPGSAFKPFVWLAALERGATPRSLWLDDRITTGKWQPSNYKDKYQGWITLDYALEKSSNTVAARLTQQIGTDGIAQTAKRMGIASDLGHHDAMGLGASEVSLLELTAAYTPFSNGGYLAEPTLIDRIETKSGKVIYQRVLKNNVKVVDEREIGMMNAMLKSVVHRGTGKAARIKGWDVAGKTGTSQNFRDALFVGYTTVLTTGVWFGNDDGAPTNKVTGGLLPAQTWHKFMAAALKGLDAEELLTAPKLPQIAMLPRFAPDPTAPKPRAIIPASGVQGQGQVSNVAQTEHEMPLRTLNAAPAQMATPNKLHPTTPQMAVPTAPAPKPVSPLPNEQLVPPAPVEQSQAAAISNESTASVPVATPETTPPMAPTKPAIVSEEFIMVVSSTVPKPQ